MKILQVVPLLTPDSAYGGPITVAVNQSRALAERGHQVELAGAALGYDDLPSSLYDLPAHLFSAVNLVPHSGFAGLFSSGLYRWFKASHTDFDVIHFHLSRSLTTLPLARLARRSKTRYVTQTHGMIDRSSNALAGPLDAVLTRPALRGAAARFYLTPREREDLGSIVGKMKLNFLPNGVPSSGRSFTPAASGKALEVLFLARLQERKRPLAFVEVARRLRPEMPHVRFTLVGPDEGQAAAVQEEIESISDEDGAAVRWEGAVSPDATLSRMADADVYVLPSVDEPFPMSVLEAMSVGLPVIVTDTCGLAESIQVSGSGIVVDGSIDALEDALRLLIQHPDIRADMGRQAYLTAVNEFGMDEVARQLETSYAAENSQA